MASLLTTQPPDNPTLLAKALVGKGRLFQITTTSGGMLFLRATNKTAATTRVKMLGQNPTQVTNITTDQKQTLLANPPADWVVDAS